MKKNSFPICRSLLRLICVLIIVLFQLPTISLALDLKKFGDSTASAFTTGFESNSPAFSTASPSTVFSNTTSITITDRNNNTTGGPVGISNPYPSTIAVSGLSGTVSDVNVTLTGYSSLRPRDNDFVLVGPNGQALTLMADAGGTGDISNVNLTFDDSASTQPPETTILTSGTYKPVDYVFSATDRDDFPSPGPSSVNDPAPTGSSTLASVFNGINPNGDWKLFAIDDSQGDGNSTVSGGWSIDITTAGGVAATNTTVSSNTNPALTTQTITFTSTTTQVSDGNPVTAGTVSFTNNGAAIAGCTNVAVNASGNAACMTTLPEGTRTIAATYSGTASFGQSSGSLSQVVNSMTVVNGSQFCNNGGITIPDPGAATPYPSNITVSGLTGTIASLTVNLNGLNAPRPSNMDFLLVGPAGQAFQIVSDIGDINNPAVNLNLTLDDSAGSQPPQNAAIASGTFRPTDYDVPGSPDSYPAPAPSSFNQPAPSGAATFASVYGGANPNGTWRLYVVDDGIGGGASSLAGYCLNFTLNKFTTTTTVASSQNPIGQGMPVTFTATVNTGGNGAATGLVEFFDGMTSLGTGTLNASGQATLTTSTLAPGTRNITAQYLGANVGAGGGGFANSTSGVLQQRITVPTAASINISGRVQTASGRGITKALVTITDGSGNTRTATTNPFGFYRFTDVAIGGYVISVSAKNRQFAPQFITFNGETNNLNFVAPE